jgi:hypothetical protein
LITRNSANGVNANFHVGAIGSVYTLTLDYSLLYTIWNTTLSTIWNDSLDSLMNVQTLSMGSIVALSNINNGLGYTTIPSLTVDDIVWTANLAGTIAFTTSSANVVGTGTTFTSDFGGSNVYILLANSTTGTDIRIVTQVVDDTHLVLDDFPLVSSGGPYNRGVPLIAANYSENDLEMLTDGTYHLANIMGSTQAGEGIISAMVAKDSGFGYYDNEFLTFGKQGVLSVAITVAGTGYANNDQVVFTGGAPSLAASGTIITDGSGAIVTVSLNPGGGYRSVPMTSIVTSTGSGGVITASINGLDTNFVVNGRVLKSAVGQKAGFWTSTKGFLNADKYIQDSFYYQDYSYEIRSRLDIATYAQIIKKLVHESGTEMFGKVVINDFSTETMTIVDEGVS